MQGLGSGNQFLKISIKDLSHWISWSTECLTLHPELPQFSSVGQLCPALCDSMDYSTPGLPVHHQLPELAQTRVHWVGDAIQPSHPLLLLPSIFPSIRVFSSESVLRIRWPKYWNFSFSISPFNNIQDWFPLGLTSLVSLHSKRLSRIFSNTTVQMHQLFGAQFSLKFNSHIHAWPLEKP